MAAARNFKLFMSNVERGTSNVERRMSNEGQR